MIITTADLDITSLTDVILPLTGVLVVLIISLLIKDSAISIAKGLLFRLGDNFNEGDRVILDGEPAIIVKMGITQTVFGIVKPNNQYCWRYISNQRVHTVKLEKVIILSVPEQFSTSE